MTKSVCLNRLWLQTCLFQRFPFGFYRLDNGGKRSYKEWAKDDVQTLLSVFALGRNTSAWCDDVSLWRIRTRWWSDGAEWSQDCQWRTLFKWKFNAAAQTHQTFHVGAAHLITWASGRCWGLLTSFPVGCILGAVLEGKRGKLVPLEELHLGLAFP